MTFAPVNLLPFTEDAERCHMGHAPTLAQVRETYGSATPVIWLLPFLYDIQEYCGTKTKWSANQVKQLAQIIAREFFFLKVSELMLFFIRFKSARYGRFFGAEDPMVVMEALQKFNEERGVFYDEYYRREQLRAIEERKKGAISYEEYLRLKEEGKISCI